MLEAAKEKQKNAAAERSIMLGSPRPLANTKGATTKRFFTH